MIYDVLLELRKVVHYGISESALLKIMVVSSIPVRGNVLLLLPVVVYVGDM